jgi:quinol monooxygenase YgiN
MIHAIIRFQVQKAKLKEAEDSIQEFVALIKSKESKNGTLFKPFQDLVDKTFFTVLISFADKKAHMPESESHYCLEFVTKLYPVCDQTPLVTWVNEIDEQVLTE